MDDGGPTASIIIFIGLLLLDMLFYGFGAAIQNLNSKDIQKKAEEKDKKSQRLWAIMLEPSGYVNTVSFVITLINVVMGGCYLGVWLRYIKNMAETFININIEVLGAVSLVITVLMLVYVLLTFGVLIPKRVALKYSVQWAYACISPIYYITKILLPLTGIAKLTAKSILRIFGIKEGGDLQDVTEEEIISMVNEGHEQGVFQASEAEMISNIFEYGDKEAKDIMTHRKNIVAVDSAMFLKDAIHLMLEERNSRYPVYEENVDHIIGIIYLKDAMRLHAMNEELNCPVCEAQGLIREAEFIPETRNIDALFKMMQSLKIQMVIVSDEYGQTAGLVTMEDILEEIVGNILDEYDEDTAYIEKRGEDEYLMEGMTPLEELEERFSIDFEEEEFDTLNGFLISKMKKIPEEDEEFEIDVCGYNFKVISVENKMIHTVSVTKKPVIEEGKTDSTEETEKNEIK